MCDLTYCDLAVNELCKQTKTIAVYSTLLCSDTGSSPSGGPKLTQRRYHYKGSRYVTVGLLGLGTRP